MDFLLLPFLHVFQLFVVYPCIVCLFVRSLTLSLSLPHFLEWKTEAKSVHWVCNIYYGWWCGTECFVYFMYAQNNKQQTRKNLWCVIHVEGGMVAHTHERKKRVQRQKREIVRKNGIANDSKVERKGITFTYYIYICTNSFCYPWPMTENVETLPQSTKWRKPRMRHLACSTGAREWDEMSMSLRRVNRAHCCLPTSQQITSLSLYLSNGKQIPNSNDT